MAEAGDDIRLARLTGDGLAARLGDLARLRIAVFREWPYLYAGSAAYEERYLRTYAEAAGSVIVGAFAGGRLVGAATALPLAGEPPELTEPFARAGFDLASVFYFGESVLERAFRGRGIGVRFFVERERAALDLPQITHAAFCAVVRPDDHPRRPAGYAPLDPFWRRRGYAPAEGLVGQISWPDLDAGEETAKPMQFWTKRLR